MHTKYVRFVAARYDPDCERHTSFTGTCVYVGFCDSWVSDVFERIYARVIR